METVTTFVLITALVGLIAFYFSPYEVKIEEED
jgi:hypothetical protein